MASYRPPLIKSFQYLLHHGPVTGLDDSQLLERFVARHDEAAFAALVASHGPLVLGVCRRILRDEQEIEDAFQATFLVLVRRAGSIRDAGRLGPWLHGVARRVALRSRSEAARRLAHHRQVTRAVEDVPVRPAHPTEFDDVIGIIDEEVARLPGRYRDAVVLCDLEGRSYTEAASRLRCPLGTVQSRLARPGTVTIPSDPAWTGAARAGVVPDRGGLGGCAGLIGRGDRQNGDRAGGGQSGRGRSGLSDGRRAGELCNEEHKHGYDATNRARVRRPVDRDRGGPGREQRPLGRSGYGSRPSRRTTAPGRRAGIRAHRDSRGFKQSGWFTARGSNGLGPRHAWPGSHLGGHDRRPGAVRGRPARRRDWPA